MHAVPDGGMADDGCIVLEEMTSTIDIVAVAVALLPVQMKNASVLGSKVMA